MRTHACTHAHTNTVSRDRKVRSQYQKQTTSPAPETGLSFGVLTSNAAGVLILDFSQQN